MNQQDTQWDYLKEDSGLYHVIRQLGPIPHQTFKDPFVYLIRTIAGQQLSVKAANSINEKFKQLIQQPTPEKVLKLTAEELRSVGFSYKKAEYIHHIARFWIDEKITIATFKDLTDEEIITLLTKIKGVGRWSVEILLAFSLGRPNVFFADDLGIQQGMAIIYGWDHSDKKELKRLMLNKAETFAPHCTMVCLYIWEWKNLVKNNNKKSS